MVHVAADENAGALLLTQGRGEDGARGFERAGILGSYAYRSDKRGLPSGHVLQERQFHLDGMLPFVAQKICLEEAGLSETGGHIRIHVHGTERRQPLPVGPHAEGASVPCVVGAENHETFRQSDAFQRGRGREP